MHGWFNIHRINGRMDKLTVIYPLYSPSFLSSMFNSSISTTANQLDDTEKNKCLHSLTNRAILEFSEPSLLLNAIFLLKGFSWQCDHQDYMAI